MTIADSRVVRRIDVYSSGEVRMHNSGRWVREQDHESLLAVAESEIARLKDEAIQDITGKLKAELACRALQEQLTAVRLRLDAVVRLADEWVALAKHHEIKADRADTHPDSSYWHGGYDEGVTECVDRLRAALGCATTGEEK